MHFRLLGTNGFHVKAKNERFTAPGSRCRQNLKYENLRRLLVDYIKELHQKACARAARIFFLIQPIKSLMCGVVLVNAVVIS